MEQQIFKYMDIITGETFEVYDYTQQLAESAKLHPEFIEWASGRIIKSI